MFLDLTRPLNFIFQVVKGLRNITCYSYTFFTFPFSQVRLYKFYILQYSDHVYLLFLNLRYFSCGIPNVFL